MTGIQLEEQIRARTAAADASRSKESVRVEAQRAARVLRAQQLGAGAVVLFVASALALMDPPLAVAGSILVGILALAGYAVAHLQQLRRATLAAETATRADVERRIRARCHVLLAHVVLASAVALALLFDLLPHAGWATAVLAGLLCFCIADAAYGLRVDLPRLHRERSGL
jgi:hypothetical protein